MKKRIVALIAAMLMVGTVLAPPAAAQTPFTDVPAGVFYTEPVAWIANVGITTGTSPTTYSPNEIVTRAQMATFLWRSVGRPLPTGANPFNDVPPGLFYTDATNWLAQTGITTGTGPGRYSPGEFVTRAQMATFLHRSVGQPAPSQPTPFTDVPAGQFYSTAIQWLAQTGITTGTGPNTFSPTEFVTRGQMATFLFRSAGQPALPPADLCNAQNLQNYVNVTFWYAAPTLRKFNCSFGHLYIEWTDAAGHQHETLVWNNAGWKLVASANTSLSQSLNLAGAALGHGQVSVMRTNAVAV